jgi:hypothetical protein
VIAGGETVNRPGVSGDSLVCGLSRLA